MEWIVEYHQAFKPEFIQLPKDVRKEMLAHMYLLKQFGPTLGRPHVDTLNGSQFPNMKELRVQVHDGVWRVAFAFDPLRHAILLVAGNKTGSSSGLFYKQLIQKADQRLLDHLNQLQKGS